MKYAYVLKSTYTAPTTGQSASLVMLKNNCLVPVDQAEDDQILLFYDYYEAWDHYLSLILDPDWRSMRLKVALTSMRVVPATVKTTTKVTLIT